MLKHDTGNASENTAQEYLADEQLDLVSGGLLIGPPWEVPGEPAPGQAPSRPGTYF